MKSFQQQPGAAVGWGWGAMGPLWSHRFLSLLTFAEKLTVHFAANENQAIHFLPSTRPDGSFSLFSPCSC